MIATLWLEVLRTEKPVLWTKTIETGRLPNVNTMTDTVWAWGTPYGEFGPSMMAKCLYMDSLGIWHVELHRLIVRAGLNLSHWDTVWIDEDESAGVKLYRSGWRKYIK